MKMILKPKHFDDLDEILEQTLSAHKRAQWEKKEVREAIINIVIKRFKRSFGIL